jgi:hypothetical protein
VASATIALSAATVRSRFLVILAYENFHAPHDARATAYRWLAEQARDGELAVVVEQVARHRARLGAPALRRRPQARRHLLTTTGRGQSPHREPRASSGIVPRAHGAALMLIIRLLRQAEGCRPPLCGEA